MARIHRDQDRLSRRETGIQRGETCPPGTPVTWVSTGSSQSRPLSCGPLSIEVWRDAHTLASQEYHAYTQQRIAQIAITPLSQRTRLSANEPT